MSRMFMFVVYFDQRLGAAHSKRWSKIVSDLQLFVDKSVFLDIN